jgi:hypothetical protein
MATPPKSQQTLRQWSEKIAKQLAQRTQYIPCDPRLLKQLELHRCPHCAVVHPHLRQVYETYTEDHSKRNRRFWAFYVCESCGGIVTAAGAEREDEAVEIYPSAQQIDESIPDNAADYLQQALESIHTPAGAILLTASAIDSMLKEKNYTKGDLYSRINKAAADHLITEEMAVWAARDTS